MPLEACGVRSLFMSISAHPAVEKVRGRSEPRPVVIDLMNDSDSTSDSDPDSPSVASTHEYTAWLRETGQLVSWCNQCYDEFEISDNTLPGFDPDVELCVQCQREEKSVVDSLRPNWLF